MNSKPHSMHGQHEKQAAHPHAHPPAHGHDHPHGSAHGHLHGGTLHSTHSTHGLGIMRFLGALSQHNLLDRGWMSDYRSPRLVPVTNTVSAIVLAIFLAGVAAWIVLPASLIAWRLVLLIAASLPLIALAIGSVVLTRYRRALRERTRSMVLASIPWRGAERALDVGCGTGMMLNGVAGKLTTGTAVGIDLWEQEVGGTQDVLWANARAEGVADRIELQSMDARHLTFADAAFDVVTSTYALHHIITGRADLDQAVAEMARVLKPGGYLSLADIGPMIDLAETAVAQVGLEITQRGADRMFRLLTARKP